MISRYYTRTINIILIEMHQIDLPKKQNILKDQRKINVLNKLL